jgi:large subunit ribosomal protein L15
MKIHDLKPAPGSTRRRKRVGRGIGSGTGKTSGRGSKGQNSRSGGGVRVGFEGGQLPMAMRIPKLRGFTNPFRVEYQAVNLDTLEASGLDEITPEALLSKGLVSKGALVKILGRGELTRKVSVSAHAFSASATQAIEAAGGTTTKLDLPFGVRPAFHGSAHTNR